MATTYFHGQAFRLYKRTADITAAEAQDQSGTAPTWATVTPLACAKSASLSVSNNVIDVTCQGNAASGAGNRAVIPGQKSWSMSSELLYVTDDNADATELQALFDAGTPLRVILGDGQASNNMWWGDAYIASIEVSSAPGELVSYSVTLEGTGALTYGTIS